MPPLLQIRLRTSKAIRILRRQPPPDSPSNAMVRVLLIPHLHHKETCSTHIIVVPIRVGTRGIAVDRASLVPTNQRHLEARNTREVFLTHLASVIIAITAMSTDLCHRVSVATKRMKAWQLLSNFSPAVLEAPAPREAYLSPCPRMLRPFPIFPLST